MPTKATRPPKGNPKQSPKRSSKTNKATDDRPADVDYGAMTARDWVWSFSNATREVAGLLAGVAKACPTDDWAAGICFTATVDPGGPGGQYAENWIEQVRTKIQGLLTCFGGMAKTEAIASKFGFRIQEHAPFAFKAHSVIKLANETECTYHRAVLKLGRSIAENFSRNESIPFAANMKCLAFWEETLRVSKVDFAELDLRLRSEYTEVANSVAEAKPIAGDSNPIPDSEWSPVGKIGIEHFEGIFRESASPTNQYDCSTTPAKAAIALALLESSPKVVPIEKLLEVAGKASGRKPESTKCLSSHITDIRAGFQNLKVTIPPAKRRCGYQAVPEAEVLPKLSHSRLIE